MTPLIVPPSAPGAVTRTTRWSVSRLASSSGAADWANAWSLPTWLCSPLIFARCELICCSSSREARSKKSSVFGFSAVAPTTMPIASARNTATIETR